MTRNLARLWQNHLSLIYPCPSYEQIPCVSADDFPGTGHLYRHLYVFFPSAGESNLGFAYSRQVVFHRAIPPVLGTLIENCLDSQSSSSRRGWIQGRSGSWPVLDWIATLPFVFLKFWQKWTSIFLFCKMGLVVVLKFQGDVMRYRNYHHDIWLG